MSEDGSYLSLSNVESQAESLGGEGDLAPAGTVWSRVSQVFYQMYPAPSTAMAQTISWNPWRCIQHVLPFSQDINLKPGNIRAYSRRHRP